MTTEHEYQRTPGAVEETLGELLGEKLFIRTVTYHLVGKVIGFIVNNQPAGLFIELDQASWVADSGRFHVALRDGTLSEVEPVGRAWVNLSAVTDMFPWHHELPTEAR